MTTPTTADGRTICDRQTVTIPVAPPRDPAEYRATRHFSNRLRERVDEDAGIDKDRIGAIVRPCGAGDVEPSAHAATERWGDPQHCFTAGAQCRFQRRHYILNGDDEILDDSWIGCLRWVVGGSIRHVPGFGVNRVNGVGEVWQYPPWSHERFGRAAGSRPVGHTPFVDGNIGKPE